MSSIRDSAKNTKRCDILYYTDAHWYICKTPKFYFKKSKIREGGTPRAKHGIKIHVCIGSSASSTGSGKATLIDLNIKCRILNRFIFLQVVKLYTCFLCMTLILQLRWHIQTHLLKDLQLNCSYNPHFERIFWSWYLRVNVLNTTFF